MPSLFWGAGCPITSHLVLPLCACVCARGWMGEFWGALWLALSPRLLELRVRLCQGARVPGL